jgi:hypothetical protein
MKKRPVRMQGRSIAQMKAKSGLQAHLEKGARVEEKGARVELFAE